jgi:hypothetical protein
LVKIIQRLLYRPKPFQRAQICEDWSLGTGDMWRQREKHIYT